MLAPGAAHEEQPELLRIPPELGLGLHVDLVHAAEPVEVVHVGAAEQRAERRVDVVERGRPTFSTLLRSMSA